MKPDDAQPQRAPALPDADPPAEVAKYAVSPLSGARVPCGRASAHSWKPGKSGNPRGSSAAQRLRRAIRRAVTKREASQLADAMLEHAKAGDAQYARLLLAHLGLLGRDEAESARPPQRVVINLGRTTGGESPASAAGAHPRRTAPLERTSAPRVR